MAKLSRRFFWWEKTKRWLVWQNVLPKISSFISVWKAFALLHLQPFSFLRCMKHIDFPTKNVMIMILVVTVNGRGPHTHTHTHNIYRSLLLHFHPSFQAVQLRRNWRFIKHNFASSANSHLGPFWVIWQGGSFSRADYHCKGVIQKEQAKGMQYPIGHPKGVILSSSY